MTGFCTNNVLRFALLLGLLNAMAAGEKEPFSTRKYFFGEGPEISDISNITWAHAVNSIAELEKALNDDTMMLEADISLGTVHGSEQVVPIMAHPPANTSDLSFEVFINRIIRAVDGGAKKGAKLDFKDIKTVEPCLQMLKQLKRKKKISFPVWLNADILPGPVNSTDEPVNATEFLSLASEYSPSSMLSLGWKTNFGCHVRGKYEKSQILEMIEVVGQFNPQVPPTFPVRAGLAAESVEELLLLIATVPGSTLTLWASASDPVDMNNLQDLIDTINTKNLYIDLPFDLIDGPGNNCKESPVVIQNDTNVDNSIVPQDDAVPGGISVNSAMPLLLVALVALIFGCSF
ncbi:unnamed protein product [Allacma fusca]|uniref:Menorin-like domain-containing protein n=1 Tax=Allacma fusca TaxID=39272 RepID=A0A8J2J8S7_9HEXA|nr:unnamed protein product [Allacma fusca]